MIPHGEVELNTQKYLESNIKKLYIFKFFRMFLLLMPVIVPFFNSRGLKMVDVYLLQTIFGVTCFIFEIPSGYISDLLGRKTTIIASTVLTGIGFLLFPMSSDISLLIVAEIILALAVSLFSGTDTSLIYDTLEALGKSDSQMKVLGKSLYYFSLGEAVAGLFASIFIYFSISLDSLAIISAVISWIPFFIALSFVEPNRKKMDATTHIKNFKYIYKQLFKESALLNLILLNMIFYFSATLLAVWVYQKYWQDIGIPIAYFGFLWAITNFTVSISAKYAHKFEKLVGSSLSLIIIGIIPFIGFLGISLTQTFYGFFFCLLFNICRGLGQVIFKDALNKRVTSDFRATANSISQLGVRGVFVIIGPIFGHLIDSYSISRAAQISSYFYFFIFIIVMVPLLNQRKSFLSLKNKKII